MQEGIVKSDFSAYTRAAHHIFRQIIAPVEKKIQASTLIIIPDNELTSLPFEALLTTPVDTTMAKDFRTLPYLLHRHSISYSYSTALLLENMAAPQVSPTLDFLAFAPVFPKRFAEKKRSTTSADILSVSRALSPGSLPATRDEVLEIEKIFQQQRGFWAGLTDWWYGKPTRVFLENEAKEQHLKTQDLKNYRYLHIATHGIVNEDEPGLSYLLFAESDSSNVDKTSTDDGILHLTEIYPLSLNADLVVLSACETGSGRYAAGEGLIGLARGFSHAGARNLLASFWQVNDGSTANLMTNFYQLMLNGENKSRALQAAKQKLMAENPYYANPYYWAPFVLIGR